MSDSTLSEHIREAARIGRNSYDSYVRLITSTDVLDRFELQGRLTSALLSCAGEALDADAIFAASDHRVVDMFMTVVPAMQVGASSEYALVGNALTQELMDRFPAAMHYFDGGHPLSSVEKAAAKFHSANPLGHRLAARLLRAAKETTEDAASMLQWHNAAVSGRPPSFALIRLSRHLAVPVKTADGAGDARTHLAARLGDALLIADTADGPLSAACALARLLPYSRGDEEVRASVCRLLVRMGSEDWAAARLPADGALRDWPQLVRVAFLRSVRSVPAQVGGVPPQVAVEVTARLSREPGLPQPGRSAPVGGLPIDRRLVRASSPSRTPHGVAAQLDLAGPRPLQAPMRLVLTPPGLR